MLVLDGSSLTLEDVVRVADAGERVVLAPEARVRVEASRAVVDALSSGAAPVYGINTGFGSFAETRIPAAAIEQLQLNLVRSHAAGLDDPLPARVVRATMLLRANVLARGHSGLSVATLAALKILSHPASVDSIPTSANKEDHVSMSMSAALKAERVLVFARQVSAIELLAACQAIDFLAPVRSSDPLMRVHARIRADVATLTQDRPPSADIAAIAALIAAGEVETACGLPLQ